MKQKILKYSLFGAVLLAGFLAWFLVDRTPGFSGASAWLLPILCFSVYAICLSLMAILVKQEIVFEFVIIISLFFSFIFAFSKWHFIVLAFCILLMLAALRDMRKDLDLNIKIDLWKSLFAGRFKMILALALVISSQYFFMLNNTNGEKVIPKLDTASFTKKLVEPILGIINPNFKTIQEEGLTVDQFIVKSQQENGNVTLPGIDFDSEIDRQIPADLPVEQKDALKQQALKEISNSQANLSQKNQELVLQQGRSQLSQMVGHAVSGNEKISDVFAGLIDKKINDYFQPRVAGDAQSALFSYIIAMVLFLTIWPLGTVLSVFWFGLVIVIFKIIVHFGLVEIKTVTVQREMIA